MPRFSRVSRAPGRTAAVLALALLVVAGGADGGSGLAPEFELVARQARAFAGRAVAWYGRTPPADRIIWGGLIACAGLGAGVLLERLLRLRRRRVTPPDFMSRFLDRLRDGKLDSGKALDICELNSSPAARVALAAVRRWGRPVADLERAVALAARVEADRLRRNVGTLRRIAALTPLLGLLGTLLSAGRALSAIGPASTPGSWGPALGAALSPLDRRGRPRHPGPGRLRWAGRPDRDARRRPRPPGGRDRRLDRDGDAPRAAQGRTEASDAPGPALHPPRRPRAGRPSDRGGG